MMDCRLTRLFYTDFVTTPPTARWQQSDSTVPCESLIPTPSSSGGLLFGFMILFLMVSNNLFAAPSQLPSWNDAGWKSSRQQQQWSHYQQSWNRQNDQHAMQRKQQKENQKWERAQKKRQKSSFRLLQPVV